MIHSMTAFARSETVTAGITVNMEVRSVNGRNLDVNVRLPSRYLGLEERIRSVLVKRLTRGRIDIRVQIQDKAAESLSFDMDEDRAAAYYQALERVRQKFGIETPISLDLLIDAGGIIKPVEVEPDPQACLAVVDGCLETVLADLIDMRKTEGAFLARDFDARLTFIEQRVRDIEAASTDLPDHYRRRLQERISTLTRGIVEIDPARIAQEAALLADRSDISEELVRVYSHVEQFRDLIRSDEPAGRKLNFLIQEFNREFNTMGSKTGQVQISHRVVEVKAELEKLREQIQNVE